MKTVNYFEVSLSFKKAIETQDGRVKKVTEVYLIDALTFTEAEKRMLTEVDKMGGIEEPFINSIKRSNITELVVINGLNYWFKAKVIISIIGDEAGRRKNSSVYYLISGDDLESAQNALKDELSRIVVPCSVESITETKIVEVYPYEEQAPEGFKRID